jgi:hypothetical protein
MNIGEILIWESSNLTPTDSRSDRVDAAGALVPGKGGVHGAGLAPTLWPSPPEKFSHCAYGSVRRPAGSTWPNIRERSLCEILVDR